MKKLVFATAIIVVVVLIFIVLGMWGTGVTKRIIEEKRHNIVGLALQIGGYEVSIINAKLKLKDIKIYPANRESENFLLASAKELSIKIEPLALLHNTLHANEIKLEKPKINYIITGNKSSNWDTLKLATEKDIDKKDVKKEKSSWLVIIDDAKIENGDVLYRNKVNGQNLELRNVDISVEDIMKANNAGELPTSIELKANIGNTDGRIYVKGRADVLSEKISFDIDSILSSTPIVEFSSFYINSIPFSIVAGSIAVNSKAYAKDNILQSSHYTTISDLQAGGMNGELINKFVLSQTGPIEIETAVNGDLSTGKFNVSSELSKNLAEEILKRAALAAPEMVIKTLKTLAPVPLGETPLEKGIKNLFKKK